MGARSISTKELRAECTLLERVCMSERLITKEHVVAQRPGGLENPDKTARGWLNFYRWLTRQHAKLQHELQPASRAIADAAVMDALRAEPIAVKILGRADPMNVYPKSLDALLQVHALDRQLAFFTARHATLLQVATTEAMSLVERVMVEIAYTYQCLAWIVTTPGPGMPYGASDARPEPPVEISSLEPWDVVRLVEAHHQHLMRTAAISALVDERRQGEEGGQRPSWSMFIGSLAMEMGVDPVVLMKDRDLISLLAAVRLRNAASAPRESAADAARSGRHAVSA